MSLEEQENEKKEKEGASELGWSSKKRTKERTTWVENSFSGTEPGQRSEEWGWAGLAQEGLQTMQKKECRGYRGAKWGGSEEWAG